MKLICLFLILLSGCHSLYGIETNCVRNSRIAYQRNKNTGQVRYVGGWRSIEDKKRDKWLKANGAEWGYSYHGWTEILKERGGKLVWLVLDDGKPANWTAKELKYIVDVYGWDKI